MNPKRLYFIALLPPQEVSSKITSIKDNFAKDYHSKHALKLLPHITIQPPFRRNSAFEDEMQSSLQKFFLSFSSFEISLSGYGCFNKKNNKVVFINVIENKTLNEIQMKLKNHLQEELKFTENELPQEFHPHITIAHRDLSPENFRIAWPVYEKKLFEESFTAGSAFLFRHTSQKWEVQQKFPFNK